MKARSGESNDQRRPKRREVGGNQGEGRVEKGKRRKCLEQSEQSAASSVAETGSAED